MGKSDPFRLQQARIAGGRKVRLSLPTETGDFWRMKTRQPLPATIGPGDNRRIAKGNL